MVDHCDSGCCVAWFTGWEKALEPAEAIQTAQEMPTSHPANFIPAPPKRVSYRATDLVDCDTGYRNRTRIFDLGASPLPGGGTSARCNYAPPHRGQAEGALCVTARIWATVIRFGSAETLGIRS